MPSAKKSVFNSMIEGSEKKAGNGKKIEKICNLLMMSERIFVSSGDVE